MKRSVRSLSLFTAFVLAFALVGNASPANAGQVTTRTANFPGSSLDQANKQQINDVFNGINAFRKSKGKKPVRFNVTVSEMAEDWSSKMASDSKKNSHTSFRHNPNFWTDSRVQGRWNSAGEIIAYRYDTSGQGLVDQWIDSPPHNAIMKDSGFTEIGIGIAKNKGAFTMYGTVNFFSWDSGSAPSGSFTSPEAYFKTVPVRNVTPAKPSFNATKNTVKIPKKTGVTYYINGTKKAARTYSYKGAGTVTAKPSSGSYKLSGTKSWKFNNRK